MILSVNLLFILEKMLLVRTHQNPHTANGSSNVVQGLFHTCTIDNMSFHVAVPTAFVKQMTQCLFANDSELRIKTSPTGEYAIVFVETTDRKISCAIVLMHVEKIMWAVKFFDGKHAADEVNYIVKLCKLSEDPAHIDKQLLKRWIDTIHIV